MLYTKKLLKTKLIKRYKRFISEHVDSSNNIIKAHCANPGSMMGLLIEGSETWLSKSSNTNRKLHYTWELVKNNGSLIGINTHLSNKIVKEAIENNKIAKLDNYNNLKEEIKYGVNSRIDILLEEDHRLCFIEVKNVTLSRNKNIAEFPDSVTQRGTKQLLQLQDILKQGNRAVVFFLVQREDCKYLKISKDIDFNYYKTLKECVALGLEIICFDCILSSKEIFINKKIIVEI